VHFLEVVELPNDLHVVEAFVMWGCIVIVTKQLAEGCWHGLDLSVVGLKAQLFKDAVNQVRLGQVDHSVLVALNVDTKEVRGISLNGQLQTYPLHVLNDPV